MTDGNGCTSNATVTVGDNPATFTVHTPKYPAQEDQMERHSDDDTFGWDRKLPLE